MSRRPPPEFGSWDAADAAFDQFMADVPLRRDQLRERLTVTGGPVLDGTVESLDVLNEWYIETALSGEPDGMDWWPVWMKRPQPATRRIPGVTGNPIPDDVIRLWELVSVYVGDVLLPLIPHSRWVCFRAKNYREVINGRPIIDMGDPDWPSDPISVGNANVPRMVSFRGTGHRFDTRPESHFLSDGVLVKVRRFKAGRDAGTLKWQKAPTGPDAHRRTKNPDW